MLKKTPMLIITLWLLLNIFNVSAADTLLWTETNNANSAETTTATPVPTVETTNVAWAETNTVMPTDETKIQSFDVIGNKWTIEVTKDTIFVWTTDKNTSIIDLFSNLNIDWKDVTDSVLKNIDVRYVNPTNVDFKISSDTDIIDKDSKIYVLFKTTENGWLVSANSTISFELKNFKFQEIWTVSNLESNSYTKIYNVNMKDGSTEVVNTMAPVIDETILSETPTITNVDDKVIDNTILETNNTWITDNSAIIIISILFLLALIAYPSITRFRKE